MQAIAAIPAVALLAGSAAGLLVPSFPLSAGFTGLAVAAAVAVWAWQLSRPHVLAVAVAVGFFSGGLVLAVDAWARAWRPPLRILFEELARRERARAAADLRAVSEEVAVPVALTGVLRADAAVRPDGAVSLSLDIISPARGGVLLTVAGSLAAARAGEWRAGRVIRAPAQLRRPSRYLDPGVADEERSLARRGTTLVGTVKSAALVDVVAAGGWLSEHTAASRAHVRRAIAASVGRWSVRSSAIVTAIVVGDRAGLDDELERKLQEAGTYHVIAISGGNIAILAGLTLIGFRVAGVLGRTAMLSAIAALLAYGYFVGGGASVNRATLMAVVYFAARAIDLRGPPANVLALSAGLLVAARPLAVFDPGFLLTFGATAAILFAVPVVPLRRLPRLAAPVVAMFAASVAAESVLMPVSAFLFSRVTLAGLAANFAAIPLMALAQVAGMALVPANWVSPAFGAAVGWAAHAGAEGLVWSAEVVRVAPFLTWRVAPPSALVVAMHYGGLVCGWTLWRYRVNALGSNEGRLLRAARLAASVIAIVAAFWVAFEPWAAWSSHGDGRLHVTFLDVGQGDSAFVRLPGGSTFVVDAGGLTGNSTFDVGERVVAPVVRQSGARTLDTVAVTHGDLDHAGGARAIVSEFRPRDVWEGIPVPPLATMREIRTAAAAVGARWANVQTGDLLTIDEVQVVVRHPRPPDWERQDVRNDDSIVLELLWRDVSIVLTGDIGRDVEREITPLFAPSALRVVKVPHHGSLTSSSREFVRALAPRVAVVSAGRGNNFGHPAPDVLDRYRDAGAEIFRTDQDGAVTIDTDGSVLDVRTFTGQRVFVRPLRARVTAVAR